MSAQPSPHSSIETDSLQSPDILIDGELRHGSEVLLAFESIRCDAARWTALLGASGVGKSTLLRILAGLPVHWQFNGSITTSDNKPLENRVTLMAQQDLLLPWANLVKNVALGARLRGEKVNNERTHALIERVGLIDHLHKRPTELSGGQRQRVALARTLMEDRPIVLLDEPFSALDARTRSEMQDLAAELLEDRTVVMVTHDPAEAARLGHRVLLLTTDGVEEIEIPDSAPPRPVDDSDTLMIQGKLLRRLREGS